MSVGGENLGCLVCFILCPSFWTICRKSWIPLAGEALGLGLLSPFSCCSCFLQQEGSGSPFCLDRQIFPLSAHREACSFWGLSLASFIAIDLVLGCGRSAMFLSHNLSLLGSQIVPTVGLQRMKI